MTTLIEIRQKAADFSDMQRDLQNLISKIKSDQDRILGQHRQNVEERIELLAIAGRELQSAIESNPHLFEKPKSLTEKGIKFGFQKKPGKFKIEDELKTVQLIKSKLPKWTGLLINTKASVSKDGLKNLSAKELKSIGVQIVDAADEVLIKPVDNEFEKLVSPP